MHRGGDAVRRSGTIVAFSPQKNSPVIVCAHNTHDLQPRLQSSLLWLPTPSNQPCVDATYRDEFRLRRNATNCGARHLHARTRSAFSPTAPSCLLRDSLERLPFPSTFVDSSLPLSSLTTCRRFDLPLGGRPHAGRNFPDRPGWSVVLRGKFDSEELSSDPSEHESVVDIQNELVRETLPSLRPSTLPSTTCLPPPCRMYIIRLDTVNPDERLAASSATCPAPLS